MARSTGKGTLCFGMVSIPVKLYTTSNSATRVGFNQLDPQGRRLKQQYVDPDGNVVERGQMLKGYEFTKDRFVTFTQDEIKSMAEASSPNMGIEEFVPASQVPPTFIEKSYYLSPDNGGARAYSLLAKALKETDKVGLAKWCCRGKTNLVMVAPHGDGLALHQLFYADEVVAFDEVRVAPEAIKDAELQMAKMLIEQVSKPKFEPSNFVDDVKARIERAIDAKINGQPLELPKEEAPKEQIMDLMAALKASLKAA